VTDAHEPIEPAEPAVLTESQMVRQLRGKIAAREMQIAALGSVRRELAMRRAGVDLRSKIGKLFARTYQGEMTEAAIRAEATDIGLPSHRPQVLEEALEPVKDTPAPSTSSISTAFDRPWAAFGQRDAHGRLLPPEQS
jgi:hypothetical protein